MLRGERLRPDGKLHPMIDWADFTDVGLISTRVVLSVVFFAAGGAKLVDPMGERRALIDFGVPHRLAPALAIVLPLAELAVALALIPVSLAWFGAVGALSLLLLFVAAIGVNLALGRTPDCHCFGQLHSAPAGWSTLLRNAMLASAAGFLVWHGRIDPGPSLLSWLSNLAASGHLALLGGLFGITLLAGQTALLVQILKQQGRILLRLDTLDARSAGGAAPVQSQAPVAGLPIGSPAPSFRLSGLDGGFITLEDLLAKAKPVLLLFTNPKCGPCQALLPEVGRWHGEYSAKLTIALISEGTAADNRVKAADQEPSPVLLQQQREVADLYSAWGTPSALLIRADGLIASSLAQGADAIRTLVGESLRGTQMLRMAAAADRSDGNGARVPLTAAKPGDLAPQLELADLNGKTVQLEAFRGRKVVLLFWNPRCGFCQRMLHDLQDWDANPSPGAPRLVVVSAGTV